MAQLHEYQAKKILSENGIAISRGSLATTAAEAGEIAEKLGGEVVIKAQIHSTSRAAGGGIRFAKSFAEAEKIAAEMLGREIGGNLCKAVLVDEKAEIEREFYLGFIIDTALKRPVLLFSDSGGSGIEERAESMRKLVCSIRKEPTINDIWLNLVFPATKKSCKSSFDESKLRRNFEKQIAEILQKLYRVAKATDARTAEINPLALLKDGRLVALDCRISVDDYADFRQKHLGIEIARELGHTPTKLERIAWEIEKDDFRGTFYFVEILEDQSKIENRKSKIGFHGAGGGGSMASLDAAQRNGLSPACYVDTSGNPPASKVYRAAQIILSIPNIKGYFLSGSGVASQEQFGLARGVLKAFLEVRPNIPAVLRLGGNGEEYAKELVEKYSKFLPAPMEAYQKQHSADFCAARLQELIEDANLSEPPAVAGGLNAAELPITNYKLKSNGQQTTDDRQIYKFKTRTGEITFDHSVFAEKDAAPIVEACPVKILKLDERRLPVLAITPEEAEKGKCIECLACEFASLDLGLDMVKIDFPINLF